MSVEFAEPGLWLRFLRFPEERGHWWPSIPEAGIAVQLDFGRESISGPLTLLTGTHLNCLLGRSLPAETSVTVQMRGADLPPLHGTCVVSTPHGSRYHVRVALTSVEAASGRASRIPETRAGSSAKSAATRWARARTERGVE